MSRLSFFFKRLVRMDFKKMWETTGLLKERSGKSRLWLLLDMLRCGVRYNAGYMDYKIAAMYSLNDEQKKTVITRGISNSIVRRMNDKAYWHFFDDKTEFNTLFAGQIGRKWIRSDENLTEEQLADFLSGLPSVLFKPLEGSSGVGIEKFSREDWEKIDFGENVFSTWDSAARVYVPYDVRVNYDYDPENPIIDPEPEVCPWCGGEHSSFFQGIVGFFHRIFALILGARY